MKHKKEESSLGAAEKIKLAAHRLFLEKGFGSTSVRDIAETAGTNVALVNYYFGSKNQLFEVIMREKTGELFGKLKPIFTDEDSTLEEKIIALTNTYVDFLLANADLVTFILNETRKKNFEILPKPQVKLLLTESRFVKQLEQRSPDTNPLQLFFGLIGMIVMPFVAKPIIMQAGLVEENQFRSMMDERKNLIPLWIKSILSQKQ